MQNGAKFNKRPYAENELVTSYDDLNISEMSGEI